MFEKTAEIIIRKLQENNKINSEQYEICRFGFKQGLTIILNAITMIVIGTVMCELWQTIIFMTAYVPLRSNAGGYHAKTAMRCYIYSILLMVAVLLAIKHLIPTRVICIIILIISDIIIISLAPVEDNNKLLDSIEKIIYKKRTLIITVSESIICCISMIFELQKVYLCIMLVLTVMAIILCTGKLKNSKLKLSNDVH